MENNVEAFLVLKGWNPVIANYFGAYMKHKKKKEVEVVRKSKVDLPQRIKENQKLIITKIGRGIVTSREVHMVLASLKIVDEGTQPNAVGRALSGPELNLPSIKLRKKVFYDLTECGLSDEKRLQGEDDLRQKKEPLETIIFAD